MGGLEGIVDAYRADGDEGPETDLDLGGKDLATVEKDCDRNFWMNADEAVEYGVGDKILEKVPQNESDSNGGSSANES